MAKGYFHLKGWRMGIEERMDRRGERSKKTTFLYPSTIPKRKDNYHK